jgi:hypothetical protein
MRNLDGDFIPDTAAVSSWVTLRGLEVAHTQVGDFADALRIETKIVATGTLSATRRQVTVEELRVDWYARGIGRRKQVGAGGARLPLVAPT